MREPQLPVAAIKTKRKGRKGEREPQLPVAVIKTKRRGRKGGKEPQLHVLTSTRSVNQV